MLAMQPQEDSDGGTQGAEGTAEVTQPAQSRSLTSRAISSPALHCSDTHLVGPLANEGVRGMCTLPRPRISHPPTPLSISHYGLQIAWPVSGAPR